MEVREEESHQKMGGELDKRMNEHEQVDIFKLL